MGISLAPSELHTKTNKQKTTAMGQATYIACNRNKHPKEGLEHSHTESHKPTISHYLSCK